MLTATRTYDRWRQEQGDELGPFSDFILVLPDLVTLLLRLARDGRVPLRYKLYLGGGLAYLVSPFDIFPDRMPGPLGRVDDLIIAVSILNLLLNHVDTAIVEEHWSGDQDLLVMVRDILQRADGWVGASRIDRILKHLGLAAPGT